MNRLVRNSLAVSVRPRGNLELASGINVEGSRNTRSPGQVDVSGYNFENGVKQYE